MLNPFTNSLAGFANKNATASEMFSLLSKAIAICETQCAIKVVAATCDITSANHKIFGIHFVLTHGNELNAALNAVYRTIHFVSKYKLHF